MSLAKKALQAQSGKPESGSEQSDPAFEAAADELFQAVKDGNQQNFKRILKATLNIHRDG